MNLTIKKVLTKYNFTDKNDIGRIKYIVIHYFGSLGTAESVANYFASAYRGASAHYSLDDGSIIYQSVEDGDIAWHCGTSGSYFNACRNSNSIGIEVKPYKIYKEQVYSSDLDWYFTDKTISNLITFVRYLMDKYNIDIDHIVRHYDVTHKYCPRPFMGDDINIYYKLSGNKMWNNFKSQLGGDEVTEEQYRQLYSLVTEIRVKQVLMQKDIDRSQQADSLRSAMIVAKLTNNDDRFQELATAAKSAGYVTGFE
jgi:N-acetylmuramoyl-L-alanine amidase CwlA